MPWPYPVQLLFGHTPSYYDTDSMGAYWRWVTKGKILPTGGFDGRAALTFDAATGIDAGTNLIFENPNVATLFPGDATNGGSSRRVTDDRHFQVGSLLYIDAYPASDPLPLYLMLNELGWVQCMLAVNTDGTLSIYRSFGFGDPGEKVCDVPGGPLILGSDHDDPTHWNILGWYGAVATFDGWSELYQGPGDVPSSRRMYLGSLNTAGFADAKWSGVGFGGDEHVRHCHMYLRQGAFEWGVGDTDPRRYGGFIASPFYPADAGSYTAWTPNTGTVPTAIDDTVPDEDATFVAPASEGDAFSVSVEAVPVTRVVYGAQLTARFKLGPDASAATLTPMAVVSGGRYANGPAAASGAYAAARALWTTDPSTGVAWSRARLNAAEWGGIA